MIRIVIADDSYFMRKVLSDLFARQADFEVIDTAVNGKEAVEKAVKLKPDVMTMDINMPVMDGLTALGILMKDSPVPVVMFSSLTKEGADATIKALSLGAVDFIGKTGGSVSSIDGIADEIVRKVREASKANIKGALLKPAISAMPRPVLGQKHIAMPERHGLQRPPSQVLKPGLRPPLKPSLHKTGGPKSSALGKLVVIGTSTGGPKALQAVIPALPKDLPCGVLIVQHMPPGFTKSLAERLNEISQISVKEAENNDIIEAGHAYIAPGNYHMVVERNGTGRRIALNQAPPIGTLRPAADILFDSAAQFGSDVVSVILTGIGNDGAAGMQKIKAGGGMVIAEHESTTVVYGMPKAVIKLGLADEIHPLQDIAGAIVNAVK